MLQPLATQASSVSDAEHNADVSSGSTRTASKKDKDKSSATSWAAGGFLPWSHSDAIIKFTLFRDDPLSSFIDSAWGNVKVAVKDLVANGGDRKGGLQPEVSRWYNVSLIGSTSAVNAMLSHIFRHNVVSQHGDIEDTLSLPASQRLEETSTYQLQIRMQMDLRDTRREPTAEEVENSR